MNIIVHNSKCKGEVIIPPSKSDMHRAIISASLSKGKSVIENVIKSHQYFLNVSRITHFVLFVWVN